MKKIILFIAILTLISFSGFANYPQPERTVAKYYNNAKVVKVKYSQGDTYLMRSYDEGREEAGVNIPIFEKDTAGTNDGRLDIYLGRSNFLRLDYDTEVEFQKVPQLRKTDLRIYVRRGGIYLDIHNLDYEKDIEIQTPDCGVFILNRGIYRINYNGVRGTEVFTYEGLAEVSGLNSSRNVMENQKIVMREGNILERPFYFYASEKDNFDVWNEERHNLANYARSSSSRYLDSGYEDYEYELSRSGRWRYSSTYRTNIWIPYSIGSDWRPYYNGRWVWSPYYGYYWYSYDPWNSFTYHYGRWHYDPFWGWYWLPGYRWSPAWVGWSYNGSYYGWTPLSRYNRPVIVINKRWLRNYNYNNGIPFNSQSSVFVRKGQLGRSVRKVALKRSSLVNFKNKGLSYSGIAPKRRVSYNQISAINSKGKTVKYKENGFKSKTFYKSSSGYGQSGVKVNKGVAYKYNNKKSVRTNSFKYSGSQKVKSTRGITRKTYKSRTKSSQGVKKSTTSNSIRVKKKKGTQVPSFSYRSRSYKTGSYGGSSSYASKTKSTYSGSTGYKNTLSKRYANKSYYPSRSKYSSVRYSSYGSTKQYGTKSSTSSNSIPRYKTKSRTYNYSSPKYKTKSYSYKYSTPTKYKPTRSYSSYRTYTPKKTYSYSGSKSYPKTYSKSYTTRSSRSYPKTSSRSYSKSYTTRSSRSYSRNSSRSSSSRSSSSSSGSSSRSVRKK